MKRNGSDWRRTRSPSAAALAALLTVASAPTAKLHAAEQRFDCVIYPAIKVKLGSPIAGLLSKVVVDRGDVVDEGALIAELESAVEVATVRLNEARAADSSEVEGKRASLVLSEKKLVRTQVLFDRRVLSEQKLDEARAEVEVAKAALNFAIMQRNIAALELERSKAAVGLRRILSPISGVVTERILFAGEYLHQESHVVIIAKIDPLHVEAFVPAEHYFKLRTGMKATIHIRAPIAEEREAQVVVIDPVFDAASRTFGVRLLLPNPGNKLPAGVRCEVAFDFP